MKILVTGSAGFIGRHLVEELELDDHEVQGWDLHGRNFEGQPNARNFRDITEDYLKGFDTTTKYCNILFLTMTISNYLLI